jgi:DNA-binding transcriptional LysR family regulator
MIDRYHLRYFLAVIDHGNFSKAAAACNVSQPTLSVGIAKMEKSLGRALFNRSNKRVELTEAGARLAVHARRIEADFADAERAASDTPAASMTRLGILPSLPSHWIEVMIERLRPEQDTHRIEIVEARERDLLERLSRGRIDVALTIIRPDGSRFAHDILFTEGYGLAMSSRHPLAERAVIDAAELADNAMIVRSQCELLSDTSRFFTARGVRPMFTARTGSEDRALAYVRSGLGITIMPDCFTAPGVARPALADFGFERRIGLIYGPHADPAMLRPQLPLRAVRETIEAFRGPA